MAIEKLKFLVTADTKNFALGMKAVAALAAAAFAAMIKVTADFEKALSKLEAISGANEKQMTKLEKKSRELGKTTAYTATQVVGLQVELAKLGFNTNEILNASGGILDLAAGLGVQLSDAATLAGSTIRAFGLNTEDTGRVVDVLAKSASSSALDFSKLTESLKLAAPIAKLYNYTIEDTVSLLGTLANAGIHGSQAGTALRQIFLELDKKGISLSSALAQVNASANPASTALRLVGKRAAGALAIIAQNGGVVKQLEKDLYGAAGAANEMRLKMEDNLKGDSLKLTSAITEMGIELGKTTTGPLRDFIQWMTDVINGSETTLGFLDSLARVFLFLEESALLAFKAVEEIWITIQTIATSNPLTGKMGIASPESFKRLALIKKRLEEINAEIIKISDYGGVKSSGGDSKTPKPPNKKNKPVGTTDYGFGFAAFFQPSAIEGLDTVLDGLMTKVDSTFTNMTTSIKKNTEEATTSFVHGWGIAASALGSLLGNALAGNEVKDLGKVLLGTLGQILIMIGGAVIAAGTALTIFGIGLSAVAAGSIAIGVGSALVAFAGSGGSSPVSSASTGGSSAASSSASVTPSSLQGVGTGGQLVATVRGQDLRFVLQGANDNYTALN